MRSQSDDMLPVNERCYRDEAGFISSPHMKQQQYFKTKKGNKHDFYEVTSSD